jgi:hypothetical protein
LLENYVQGGLRIFFVKVIEEEVAVVADCRKDQVQREDRRLGEAGVENPLHYSMVINHVGEPCQEPRKSESWNVS